MKRLIAAGVMVLMAAGSAMAQTGPGLMLQPWRGDNRAQLGASGIVLAGHVKGTSRAFTLTTFESSGRARLQSTMQGGLSFGYNLTYLNMNSSDPLLPSRLVDQSVALGSDFGNYDGWDIGGTAAIGYTGESPFSDGNAWYPKLDLFGTKALDADSQLRVILDYDGNRSLWPDVPLPLVSYTHRASDSLTYTVGVPYSEVKYKPSAQSRWNLDVNYYLPVTVNAHLNYQIDKRWTVYGAFENRFYAFHYRPYGSNKRLFFRQRRLETGAHWQACSNTRVTLAGGWAFAQQFDSGFGILNTSTVRKISDEPYVRAAVTVTF